MLEKTPKNALRVPFLAGRVPRRGVRLPVPRPTRDGEQHARRVALGPVRDVPRPSGLDGHAVVAAARSRLARAHRPPARRGRRRRSGRRPRRCSSTTSRPSTPIGGASRATTSSSPTRTPRSERLAEFCGRGLGRRARRADCRCRDTRSTRPHPDKWMRNADELEPVLGRGGRRSRVACPRRVRDTAPHRAGRAPTPGRHAPTAPPPASPPTADALRARTSIRRSRSRAGTRARSRRCSRPSARRCWSRRTRAVGSSSSAPTTARSTPTSARSRARWASARPGPDPRARHEGATCYLFQNQPAVIARLEDARAPRRVLHAPAHPHHRRHPDPRPRVHRRRALGREHAVLVPVDDRRPVQLRAALATAVRHRARARGPVPPQRPLCRRRRAPVRHRARRQRRRRRLARAQGRRRCPRRRPVG